jgi:hypothetical protein
LPNADSIATAVPLHLQLCFNYVPFQFKVSPQFTTSTMHFPHQPKRKPATSREVIIAEYVIAEYVIAEYVIAEYVIAEYVIAEYVIAEYVIAEYALH